MDRDHDSIAVPGERLVDGIVDDFENHVMQTAAVVGIADVHSRSFSYGVEPS
jgi:hypothetical protein